MTNTKKVLLATLPAEKKIRDWRAPDYYLTTKAAKYVPLGILSLASNIDSRHEIVILDASAYNMTIEETIERIESEKPDILGISAVTERIYALKRIIGETHVPYKVVGGPHTTHYAELTIQQGADAAFIGPMADLEFKKAVETEPKGVINCSTRIDQVKFPNRELVDYKYYIPKEKQQVFFKSDNRMPMFSGIGCPHKCIFCDVQLKKVQRKSPAGVVDEMQYLYSLGCRDVHILEDNFNLSTKHLHRILDEFEKRDFSVNWSGRGQARMSNELAARMAKNNFKRIHVGFEALDDVMLRYFSKDIRTKDIEVFCETMDRNNIDVLAYFIIGAPVEPKGYLESLSQKIQSLGIAHPYTQILFPSPDTPYYKQLLDEGTYKKDHWAEFMANPVPDYQIPYPYEQTRLNELLCVVDEIEKKYFL